MTPPEEFSPEQPFADLAHAILAPDAPEISADPRRAAGIAVYRNNVRAAYLRVLEDAFPVVRRLVGDGFFRYAANEYFLARPPRSRLVARYGDAFPDFLAAFEPAGGLPYLPDVARIEIEWLKAYHATEGNSLSAEEACRRLSGAAPHARVFLHPSTRLLSVSWQAHTVFAANRAGATRRLDLSGEGEQVLIARARRDVASRLLEPAPFAALAVLYRGGPLGDALEAGLAATPRMASPVLIQEIAALGIVADVIEEKQGKRQ